MGPASSQHSVSCAACGMAPLATALPRFAGGTVSVSTWYDKIERGVGISAVIGTRRRTGGSALGAPPCRPCSARTRRLRGGRAETNQEQAFHRTCCVACMVHADLVAPWGPGKSLKYGRGRWDAGRASRAGLIEAGTQGDTCCAGAPFHAHPLPTPCTLAESLHTRLARDPRHLPAQTPPHVSASWAGRALHCGASHC